MSATEDGPARVKFLELASLFLCGTSIMTLALSIGRANDIVFGC